MAIKTFSLDSRLPVSTDTPTDDPNHPKNVCKGMVMLQNQALADTKYDIYPPPRVEPFSNQTPDNFKIIIAMLLVAISLAVVIVSRSPYLRIASIAILLVCIHYATHILEKRTV